MGRRRRGLYSEGEEGTFYVWTPAQIEAVLGQSDAAFARRAYGVTAQGNFEHGATVLYRAVELDAREEARLEGLREKLFTARADGFVPAATRTSGAAGTRS